jgi:hypothetical protein
MLIVHEAREKRCNVSKAATGGMTCCPLLLLLMGLLCVAGCAADVRPGLYEGFRVRNDLQSPPSERLGKPDSPNYLEYERLKKEQAY